MKEGESITNHLNAFNLVISQLALIDVKLENEDKCILFFCSLPKYWKYLIVAISSDGTEPNMDNLIFVLLSEEMRRKSMNVVSQDALHV